MSSQEVLQERSMTLSNMLADNEIETNTLKASLDVQLHKNQVISEDIYTLQKEIENLEKSRKSLEMQISELS